MTVNIATSSDRRKPSSPLAGSPEPGALPPSVSISTQQRSDGSLLLWVEGGVMYSINRTATLVWEKLEESRNWLPLSTLVDCVEEECRGFYRDPAFRLEVERDVRELLNRLHERHLIQKKGSNNSAANYQITQGVLRIGGCSAERNSSCTREHATTPAAIDDEVLRRIKALLTPALADRNLEVTPLAQIAEINQYRSRIHTCIAFLVFAGYDILLKLSGFGRICQRIESWPVKKKEKLSLSKLKRICAGIERARIWYPKRINCMQHSAVSCYLLRRQGLPVEMVVAGRRIPFKSHAWAEVGRKVINDNQKVQNAYIVFKRY